MLNNLQTECHNSFHGIQKTCTLHSSYSIGSVEMKYFVIHYFSLGTMRGWTPPIGPIASIQTINHSRLWQNAITDNIFLNGDMFILRKLPTNSVPHLNSKSAMVKIMAWHQIGAQPLCKPMLIFTWYLVFAYILISHNIITQYDLLFALFLFLK